MNSKTYGTIKHDIKYTLYNTQLQYIVAVIKPIKLLSIRRKIKPPFLHTSTQLLLPTVGPSLVESHIYLLVIPYMYSRNGFVTSAAVMVCLLLAFRGDGGC